MTNYIFAHLSAEKPIPEGWQGDWGVSPEYHFPFIPATRIIRALPGTPLPAEARFYQSPEPTAVLISQAQQFLEKQRRNIARNARGPEALSRIKDAYFRGCLDDGMTEEAAARHIEMLSESEMAEMLENRIQARLNRLPDPTDIERIKNILRQNLGLLHPLADFAPFNIPNGAEAALTLVRAREKWNSQLSCVVIRTAPSGFDAWVGLGSYMKKLARFLDYESAEIGAVAAIRQAREKFRETNLIGWAEQTPFYSATLGNLRQLSICIRRGPMTAREIPRGIYGGTSSWDLPIVAEYNGDAILRYNDRVIWDDEESRRLHRERTRCNAVN